MSAAESATASRPPRKRALWSLRSIVVDVTGRPISEFQGEAPTPPSRSAAIPASALEPAPMDPVDRVTPPLSGATGREYHGSAEEHHGATIRTHPSANLADPAPSNRPERIYLHYLLLHLDRLSLTSLWYLRRQVNEEIAHRARPAAARADPPEE